MYIIISVLLSAAVLAIVFLRKLRQRIPYRTPIKILLLSMALIFAILHFRSQPRDEIGEQLDEASIQGFFSHLPPKDKLPARLILHGPIIKQYLADKLCLALGRNPQKLESVTDCAAQPDAAQEALVIFLDGLPRTTPAQDLPKKWLYAVFRGDAYQAESYFALPGFVGFQSSCQNEAMIEEIHRLGRLAGSPAEIYGRYFRFWKGGDFEEFRKNCRIPVRNQNVEEESP